MEQIKRIGGFLKFDTYGNIALAGFLVCAVSGIVLAIPYDVFAAYDSLALLLIANPAGVFFRNMHYWSAQFFVVFTLLHTYEHLRLKSAKQVTDGIWFRLTVSLAIVVFVMLTGFILKADADSLQARRIFGAILESLPVAGSFLEDMILGRAGSLQLIYVHHIATATILLMAIIFEHSRLLWTKKITFLLSLALISILAFFVQAPLQDQATSVLKGPWYFVGLQEMLHYTAHPGWVWIVLFFLFVLFWILKYARGRYYRFITMGLASLSVLYLILSLIGFYFRGENWQWQWPWEENQVSRIFPFEIGFKNLDTDYQSLTAQDIPLVMEKREACMLCHSELTGFSPAHDPQAMGCTSCHAGHPFSLNKERAHQGMVSIPGNLSDAAQSCGTAQCHPDIPHRVNQSLMTTNSGIVNVDRFVFGEQQSPDGLSQITEIGHGAADTHLRNLCSKCHLGSEKTETGPVNELSRGGGCLACHLNYSEEGEKQHQSYLTNSKNKNHLPSIHPSLDVQISNDHCFGCHSRSGRISTNYEGWQETLLDETEVADSPEYRVLDDKRVFKYIADDVHHAAGLDCIDCHDSYEVMGDGNKYMHEEQAVNIACADCHFQGEGLTASVAELSPEEVKLFNLRKFNHQDAAMIKKQQGNDILINTLINKEGHFLISKNTGEVHAMKSPTTDCVGNEAHKNLSCSACHTSWAPQCMGCHNAYDAHAPGYDLLEMKERKGSWVEYVGEFFAEAPTLGVRVGDAKEVIPAIPGMVMTIDKNSFLQSNQLASSDSSYLFHRLFAPAAPHTTRKQARSCVSCHNNPLAIGYGRGQLVYQTVNGKGKWKFTPKFEKNKNDDLPEDAWIGFLEEPRSDVPLSTRTDFRPFRLEEQQRILSIGACLTCHDEQSAMMKRSLFLPAKVLFEQVTDSCIFPDFTD